MTGYAVRVPEVGTGRWVDVMHLYPCTDEQWRRAGDVCSVLVSLGLEAVRGTSDAPGGES